MAVSVAVKPCRARLRDSSARVARRVAEPSAVRSKAPARSASISARWMSCTWRRSSASVSRPRTDPATISTQRLTSTSPCSSRIAASRPLSSAVSPIVPPRGSLPAGKDRRPADSITAEGAGNPACLRTVTSTSRMTLGGGRAGSSPAAHVRLLLSAVPVLAAGCRAPHLLCTLLGDGHLRAAACPSPWPGWLRTTALLRGVHPSPAPAGGAGLARRRMCVSCSPRCRPRGGVSRAAFALQARGAMCLPLAAGVPRPAGVVAGLALRPVRQRRRCRGRGPSGLVIGAAARAAVLPRRVQSKGRPAAPAGGGGCLASTVAYAGAEQIRRGDTR